MCGSDLAGSSAEKTTTNFFNGCRKLLLLLQCVTQPVATAARLSQTNEGSQAGVFKNILVSIRMQTRHFVFFQRCFIHHGAAHVWELRGHQWFCVGGGFFRFSSCVKVSFLSHASLDKSFTMVSFYDVMSSAQIPSHWTALTNIQI